MINIALVFNKGFNRSINLCHIGQAITGPPDAVHNRLNIPRNPVETAVDFLENSRIKWKSDPVEESSGKR